METAGICFLHAPLFHPAMKHVAPIRKELGVKTFFNVLGPISNPARPPKQLVGVYSLELARLYAYLYQQSGKQFIVLHSLDGYDEVSLTGPFKAITNHGELLLNPATIGFDRLAAADLSGGETADDSARIFMDVLTNGGTSAQRQAVLANAAMALFAAGKAATHQEAAAQARESLESGRAKQAFDLLLK